MKYLNICIDFIESSTQSQYLLTAFSWPSLTEVTATKKHKYTLPGQKYCNTFEGD